MKNVLKAIFTVAILLVTFNANAKSGKESVTFQVPMKCHKCQVKIEENISFEKGVKDLSVDLEKKTVKVTYKPKATDVDALKAAFNKLGYEVIVIETSQQKQEETK